jgi:PilZ domain
VTQQSNDPTHARPASSQPYAERRRTIRYPFSANAEVSQSVHANPVYARVSEIGLHGCFLDMKDPLPVGAQIFIKIFTRSDFFESSATVIYAQANHGVGVAFTEISRHFHSTLQKWLLEAMHNAVEERQKKSDPPELAGSSGNSGPR